MRSRPGSCWSHVPTACRAIDRRPSPCESRPILRLAHRLPLIALLALSAADCGARTPASTPGTGGASSSGGSTGSAGTGGGKGGDSNGGMPGQGGATTFKPVPTVLTFLTTAISADGSVLVGRDLEDQEKGVRWTAATGATVLGLLGPRALSADGLTIAAESRSGGQRILRIVGATATPLPFPRATDVESGFVAMSRDGTVIAGTSWSAVPFFTTSQAFRWTAADGVQGLGFLPGDDTSEALAMSPDGGTVVGLSYDKATQKGRPFRWSAATGTVELPVLAASSLTVPVAVNDAGVVVGESFGGGTPSFGTVSSATSRDPIVWVDGPPRVVGGCGSVQSTVAAIASNGTILGACQQAKLFLVAAVNGAAPRYLGLPPVPVGYSESDQSVSALGLSTDGTVVLGSRNLGSLGGVLSTIAVWSDVASLPLLLPTEWRDSAGVVIANADVTAVSPDASTIAGIASARRGWVLRLR